IGNNPPFTILRTGSRKLDTAAEPCEGCFGLANGAPGAGREQSAATPHKWQWNVSFQHEVIRNTTVEVGYVGSKGYDLLRAFDVNEVQTGDLNGNGIDDR